MQKLLERNTYTPTNTSLVCCNCDSELNKEDNCYLKNKSFNLVEYLDEKLKDLALEDQFDLAGDYLSDEIENFISDTIDDVLRGKLIKGKHYVNVIIECDFCDRCGGSCDIWVDNEVKKLKWKLKKTWH